MKKIIICVLAITILSVVFSPTLNGVSVNKTDITEDSSYGGTIYGYTGDHFDTWGSTPVPLALVDAGIKKTISGYPMGYYRITGLPFDQEITITASKKGYHSDTLKHTFTEKKSTYYYCFDLKEKENYPVCKQKITGGLFSLITMGSNTWSNLLRTLAFMT
jgi:hypothetical protein